MLCDDDQEDWMWKIETRCWREASCNFSVARLKYNSVDLDSRPNPEVRPSGKACSSRTVRETEKSILDF